MITEGKNEMKILIRIIAIVALAVLVAMAASVEADDPGGPWSLTVSPRGKFVFLVNAETGAVWVSPQKDGVPFSRLFPLRFQQ